MTEQCIFCRIIAGEASATIVYRDAQVTAFQDQHPAAPVHLLIVPNQHVASLNAAGEEDAAWISHAFAVARDLSRQYHVDQSGYRLVLNTGADAGQTVFHMHFHLLGGGRLSGLAR